MKFHPFVLPFTIGLTFVILYVVFKWIIWIYRLTQNQKQEVKKNFTFRNFFSATWEVVLESLVHRNIFRKHFLLGYLHMSLALGWFLLIVVGNIETKVFGTSPINPPYYPIFFEFFNHHISSTVYFRKLFAIIMDSILLIVLSGVALVFFKRLKSSFLGMKRTTRHTIFDRLAMTTLWFIFPLRLFAEAVTSGIHGNGQFLTGTLGQLLTSFSLPLEKLYMPFWWAYSIALGLFFVALPFSRYMHIPTEILLIFLRKFGVREKDKTTSYTQIEINSCPRCGICIDNCQLSNDLAISNTQPTYFFTSIRRKRTKQKLTDTCLMCGRCVETCPVGIEITTIRANQRKENQSFEPTNISSLKRYTPKPSRVAFFAGCMGHLTPSVVKATLSLLKEANVDYNFLDEDSSLCCGRPLMLVGEEKAASSLIRKNAELISSSGAEALVTTCPICAKIFTETYALNIPVFHHSQYLLMLAKQGKLVFKKSSAQVAYHDPCELGRGLGIYSEPRELLSLSVNLVDTENSLNNSLCCGGSLAITNISSDQRKTIAANTLNKITNSSTQILATGCPLCKKTFQSVTSEHQILDIAEIMLSALISKKGSLILGDNIMEEVLSTVD
jgi:Fe-S oxidoreductase